MRLSPKKMVGDSRLDSFRPVFLKQGSDESQDSAKGCQGFRETKIPNGGEVFGEVLLSALNLHVLTKLRVTTLVTNLSVTDILQTVNRYFNPEAS